MSIYAKNNGTWVPVGPAITVSAEGAPGAPELVDKNGNPDTSGGSVIYFKPAPEGAAGPNLAHGASISPNDNGEFVTVDQDNLEVAVLGTSPFTDYVVSVYGVNEAGRGEIAKTDAFQLNYNDATGGDVVDEYTRLSDNTRWRYHKFTTVGTSTFTVTDNPKTFRVLVVAGGGGGPGGMTRGSGAGAGGMLTDDARNMDIRGHNIVVGAGTTGVGNDSNAFGLTAKGGGSGSQANNGTSGGSGGGSVGNYHAPGTSGQGHQGGAGDGVYAGGGGGGAGGAGANGVYHTANGVGGIGRQSDITNVNTYYAGGGGGAGSPGDPAGGQGGGGMSNKNGTDGLGGGGGGGYTATKGGSGVVIIAYQIAATSTTRQIQQAKAEAAARQAGVEEGIQQGYSQAQDDLQEELTSLRTQIAGAAETMLIDGKEQKVTRKGRRK